MKTVGFLSEARPLGARPHARGSRPTEPLLIDDLGERLARLRWVDASPFDANVLVAEGEGRPHQPLVGDAPAR